MPPRSPARHRHLQIVPEPHALLGALFPPLSKDEITTAAERVKMYGQREPIEILGGMMVAGWQEYLGCVEAGVVPSYTTIEEPGDLVEYVVRRNIPRHLSTLERACIAVLAQQEWKKLAHERKRWGKGGLLRANRSRSSFGDGERWWQAAARVVGTKPGAVRSLAAIHLSAPDVFDAVRSGRIRILMEAKDLASQSKWLHGDDPISRRANPSAELDRAEVLRRYEASRRALPIRAIMYDLKREKRLRDLPPPIPIGRDYTILTGRDEERAREIHDGSIDLVVADISYGRQAPTHARSVARIARRVLIRGGVIALMSGHEALPRVLEVCLAEGLHFLAVGFVSYDAGGSGEGLRGHGIVDRVNCDPVVFLSNAVRPERQITHLHFESRLLDKRYGRLQKPLDAMTDLVGAACSKGAIVLDPCCGWGTTGEAAMRSGMRFIGIEIDHERAKISAARLAHVERELAKAGRGGGASRLAKSGRRTRAR